MDILDFVSCAGRPVTVPELVDALQLPKPSAHRICKALAAMGLLARDIHPKKLNAGPRFTGMALAALSSTTALGSRRAILRQVVEEVQETCTLTVLEFDELVFLDRVESASPLRLQLFAGSRVPLHCTSGGKLFLAMMPAARRDRLIRGRPLKRYTENTITDPNRLLRELDEIRKEELGRDHQEFIEGLEAIAAPVLDPQGRMVAAVSINGPATRLRADRKERHAEVLRRAAAALAASFVPEAETRKGLRRQSSR
jgi:DNA-binding IclR family transcriptional regulator